LLYRLSYLGGVLILLGNSRESNVCATNGLENHQQSDRQWSRRV